MGLSPHGRGNQGRGGRRVGRERSIPARAGEPRRDPEASLRGEVYPRTGGGTWLHGSWLAPFDGLSPHGRGNLGERRQNAFDDALPRSIPARAGEPINEVLFGNITLRVYPRTGGGTVDKPGDQRVKVGLSPHGRGNHHGATCFVDRPGSIPARAGEPATVPVVRASAKIGLSPHGRGNLEEARISTSREKAGLSPHGRGNHWTLPAARPGIQGLSPHGRGNRRPCRPGAGGCRPTRVRIRLRFLAAPS